MATAAFRRWDRDGRPWRVAVPVKALVDRLTAHGYVAYTIGDLSHLQSDAPEDHAPYSTTGWPGQHPYGWVLAVDVMPPKRGQRSKIDGKPLPSLQALGRQLRADKMAAHPGTAWIKYMNWEPERDNGGPCWHDSWQPDHRRRASSDRGHIHLSGRTDFVTSRTADGYDPVARLRTPGDDMPLTDADAKKVADAVLTRKWREYHDQNADGDRNYRTLPDVLFSTHATVYRLAAEQRLANAAILAAAAGDDGGAILARIDTLAGQLAAQASAEAGRDAIAAQERAEMLSLWRQHTDGTLDAEAVVRRFGELLAAADTT